MREIQYFVCNTVLLSISLLSFRDSRSGVRVLQVASQSVPDIVELSVSAWFYRNRTIAGFDNPARSLYVSIREIVENSLDACEDAGVLPAIEVELTRTEEQDPSELMTSGPQTFRLIVRDNGTGIPRTVIPQLIGKMLAGTKFTLRQTRGTFGLGGSLALLYGQVTTQKPVEVLTGQIGDTHYTRLVMRLDIEKNQPVIVEEVQIPKDQAEHGTTISFFLEGDWLRSKRKIIEYFIQTSIIVPYASIQFKSPDGTTYEYPRVYTSLPRKPREMKPHPRGIDVETLKNMIAMTRKKTLASFMMGSFQRVGKTIAEDFLNRAGLDPRQSPSTVTNKDLLSMMHTLTSYDAFIAPSSESLSPAGKELLEAGLKRLDPEFIAVTQRAPSVHEGHPFIVETAVAYGGDLSQGMRLYRFANRIPLLYDEGSDVSNRVIRELNLKNYGLRPEDPLAFLVHICSTRVPYKTVGKEYIGDVDAVRREIRLGLKWCLRKIGEDVRRRHRVQRRQKRENKLQRYYTFMAHVLSDATGRPVTIRKLFEGA
ncbi:MAG: DNA topoisomerase VI subunit B [Candidatus Thorarchaeota archaeon]